MPRRRRRRREVDIDAIIREVMAEYEVDPDEIPREDDPFDLDHFLEKKLKTSKRYFLGKTLGHFTCQELCGDQEVGNGQGLRCNRYWKSGHASCIIDLKEQRVDPDYIFTQDCRTHETEVSPHFIDEERVRDMVEWAVKEYLYRSGREKRKPSRGPRKQTKAHRQSLCEVCQLLGRLCTRL